jgi:hypothetical protein
VTAKEEYQAALAELAAAEAELAKANAELAAIERGELPVKPKRQAKANTKPAKKPERETFIINGKKVTRDKPQPVAPRRKKRRNSQLRVGDWRTTSRIPPESRLGMITAPKRVRMDDAPIVTKHLDPTNRPVADEYEGRECLLIAGATDGSNLLDINCLCAGCNE